MECPTYCIVARLWISCLQIFLMSSSGREWVFNYFLTNGYSCSFTLFLRTSCSRKIRRHAKLPLCLNDDSNRTDREYQVHWRSFEVSIVVLTWPENVSKCEQNFHSQGGMNKYTIVGWKVHRLTKIFSQDVTKRVFFFYLFRLVVHTSFLTIEVYVSHWSKISSTAFSKIHKSLWKSDNLIKENFVFKCGKRGVFLLLCLTCWTVTSVWTSSNSSHTVIFALG